MNILMLEWDSFAQEYIKAEFKRDGCEVDVLSWPFGQEDMRENIELERKLLDGLNNRDYQFVFSLNFFPVAAKVCSQCRVKYVSWIYDTPYLLLYSKYTLYDTNYIFLFDRSMAAEFRKNGLKHVFYLPMAAPVAYYDSIRADESQAKQYAAEISFVGSTYNQEKQNFFQYLSQVNDYTAGYLRAIMNMQKEVYGSFLLEGLLTPEVVRELQRVCPIQKGEDEWESDAWIYANYFLARKLTGEQRVEALEALAGHFQVKLYNAETDGLPDKVIHCGALDYISEMPLAFKNSKINFNLTLRSIRTGIPLRAMDIMGCGGFLLTNYQQDFLEHFEPNVDFVYYCNEEEMLALADYYLQHEEERLQIAENGYEKVKRYHTYANRVELLLQKIKEL